MRIDQITFSRFIAAVAIVIYHYGQGTDLFSNEYVSLLIHKAYIGVSYFFILSGFVMIIAYHKRGQVNIFGYLKNRLARVYPVYILSIVILLLLTSFRNLNLQNLLYYFLMVQSWIPEKATALNYPAWSISVEWLFYLLFPLLLNKVYLKTNLKQITVWIVLFWVVSQAYFYLITQEIITSPLYSIKDIHYHPIMHLNEFLAGNLAGLYFLNMVKKNTIKHYYVEIITLITVLILSLIFFQKFNFHNGILTLILVPLIIFMSLSKGALTNFFSKKIFTFLGEISFGVYILQFPVWYMFDVLEIHYGLLKGPETSTSFLIKLLCLIIFSSISYRYFESPIRNKIKNLKFRKPKPIIL